MLRIGSKGDIVREIQTKLSELGFDPGPVDGLYGPKTKKAVARFQKNKKIDIHGTVGPKSLKALGIKVKTAGPKKERKQFRELLLANPNYFGNLKFSKFKPVKAKKNDTDYEELKCVGYNPHVKQLEAVVYIKKEYGYNGDICAQGSIEYVRFYVDWTNSGHWNDVGMAYFSVYDIPGDKPLEYAVTLDIHPKEKSCDIENLPKVRAILSWKDTPPPDDPGFKPVWGNIVDVRIQIGTPKDVLMADLLKMSKAKIPAGILDTLDLSQSVSVLEPKPLTIGELGETYKDMGVPVERFAFTVVNKLLAKPAAATAVNQELSEMLSMTDIKAKALLKALAKTDGDTRYEELNCIGYDTRRRLLTGILTVKLPCGYSGDLCKKGSNIYVAFWEWDDIEVTWLYLGTAVVNVHDIKSIPNEGLHYAVSLNADFSHLRRPCCAGPSGTRIRAILSWEVPPPPYNPNWIPKWGNREETHIHIPPGPVLTQESIPYIETIGNMHVCDINQATGLADGEGLLAHYTADDSPFGKTITVTGYIDNPPGGVMEGTADPLKYQVSVRPFDPVIPEPWQPLSNDFKVWVREEKVLTPPVHKKLTQKIDPVDGFYTYLEDQGSPHERRYVIPVLAKWHTGSTHTGLWQIRIIAKTPSGIEIYGGVLICAGDGSTRSTVKIRLDNKAPKPSIFLTGFQRGSDPTVYPIGSGTPEKCGQFFQNDILHGTYTVSDQHFGQLTLGVSPTNPSHGATVNPPVRNYSIVPTSGESGTWTLDTQGMDPCGYIVRLWTRDRTIVNSGSIGFRNSDDVGFCLELPEEEDVS